MKRLNLSPRHLLPGALLAIWTAALSGFTLDWSPRALLITHLVAGFGGLLPLSLFLFRHWWRRRRAIGLRGNARYGYVALLCLALLLASGIGLLRWTNLSPLRHVHVGAAVLLLLDLVFHASWRLRLRLTGRRLPQRAATRRATVRLLLPGLFFAAASALILGAGLLPVGPAGTDLGPPVPLDHAMVTPGDLPTAQNCGQCHGEIAAGWQGSAHAHAAAEPYYQALVALFIQERGVEAARYCAGCHNPVGLLHGEVDPGQRITGESQQAAYEARALGVELAMSAAAAEGVTCAICHQAAAGAAPAALHSVRRPPDEGLRALALKAAPADHQAAYGSPALARAELCRGCHNLSTPDGLLLEPTYDEWLASDYAARGVTCQDCHMPAAPGRRVDSGPLAEVRLHGGYPGAPSSLEGITDNPQLLRQAAALDVQWEMAAPTRLDLTVLVSNVGAGHYLPTGADDLRQVWLAANLRDAAGDLLWQTGAPEMELAADTVLFRKVLGDANGRPIAFHRFWVATQILSDTRLAPGETRPVDYQISLPAGKTGPYFLAVELLYRDVSPAFAEMALKRPAPDLPHHVMASAGAVITPTPPGGANTKED